jgi:hypothetical protein
MFIIISFRIFSGVVAAGGRPLGRGPAIGFERGQGGLLRLRQPPRLKLLPAQFAEAPPAAIGNEVNVEHACFR